MVKISKQFNDSEVKLVDLLSDTSLYALNRIFGTRYSRASVKETITIERKAEEPEFWDRLMREDREIEL